MSWMASLMIKSETSFWVSSKITTSRSKSKSGPVSVKSSPKTPPKPKTSLLSPKSFSNNLTSHQSWKLRPLISKISQKPNTKMTSSVLSSYTNSWFTLQSQIIQSQLKSGLEACFRVITMLKPLWSPYRPWLHNNKITCLEKIIISSLLKGITFLPLSLCIESHPLT